jgi:hypothetical protein
MTLLIFVSASLGQCGHPEEARRLEIDREHDGPEQLPLFREVVMKVVMSEVP